MEHEATRNEQPPHYETFILRLRWLKQDNSLRCQVMLRAADSGETVYFTSLDDLLSFLVERARRTGQATE